MKYGQVTLLNILIKGNELIIIYYDIIMLS